MMMKLWIWGFLTIVAAFPAVALELVEAKFGVGERWADVTGAFQKMKRNDDLFVGWLDGNRMAGKDPAPGVAKNFIVKYRDNDGTLRTVSLPERQVTGIAAGFVPSEEFRLARAWFGCGGAKYIDVTPKIAEIIRSGKEVTLDFPTLGIDGKDDPAPGRKKEIVIFYSMDNELKSQFHFERDKFKGSSIDGSPAPIPLASQVVSPFRGMALDTAVWQWSVPMSLINKENNQPSTAFLYIPPKTQKVRGLVIGMFNMLERPLMEHPGFRRTLEKLDYGCVWIAPSPFGAFFDFRNPAYAAGMDDMFRRLADASGYAELAEIPFVGIGHSAMASFPYEMAAWKPERAIAGISYDGSIPGVNWGGDWVADKEKIMNEAAIGALAGIPFLVRDGEYSGGRNNRRPVGLLKHHPEIPVTLVADPGSGHFDINDAIVDYIGRFLECADKARGVGSLPLRKINPADGWAVDYWRYNDPPAVAAAPYRSFQGRKHYHGEEKIWVFDEAFARFHENYQARERGKKVQLVGYQQQGNTLPDRKTHAQIHPAFRPEADGQTFALRGCFLDVVPDGRAPRWSDRKVGERIPHGDDAENIRISPICGPVVAIDRDRMAVRFDRFGFSSSRRTGEIYMMAVHPGDATWRRSIQQSVLNVPRDNNKGLFQRLTFPAIPDQKLGTKSVKLGAFVNTGLPVEYFVVHGPASILDGELILTEVPAGAKFPVEVKVTAYQYGVRDQVKSAKPVTRTFNIVR